MIFIIATTHADAELLADRVTLAVGQWRYCFSPEALRGSFRPVVILETDNAGTLSNRRILRDIVPYLNGSVIELSLDALCRVKR